MERNPRDSRLRYTKKCLYDSFLGFLAEKPVSDITVIEICAQAGISRKTFYKHYSDPFDLLRCMQDDLFEDYRDSLEGQVPEASQIAPILIRFVSDNRILVKAVFENRGEGNFVDRILDDLYGVYADAWQQANPDLSENDVETLFYFVVSGLFGLVRHWLFNHPETPVDDVIGQAADMMLLADPHRSEAFAATQNKRR